VCGGWLVDGPVVVRWVQNWILRLEVYQVITIDSINDEISHSKILMSSVSLVMWWRWLVHRPVVEWWVPYWILRVDLHVQVILW